MKTQMFTNPDVWTGGSIDALMYFGARNREFATAATCATWSFPDLVGPYLRDDLEPDLQSRLDCSGLGDHHHSQLFGVMTYQDGTCSPVTQHTLSIEDDLWVSIGPTIGGLPQQWNVGAYPLDEGVPTPWLTPLREQLRRLTDHVHRQSPMLGAMYGWLDPSDNQKLLDLIAGNVPTERWVAMATYDSAGCTYFPPTNEDPPMTV